MRPVHLLPALATAFTPEGDLDLASCRRLFAWASALDVEAHFVAGTTGEFIALSHDERVAVIDAALEEIGPRGVFAHVGAASAYEAARLARATLALGARRFAAITPYFSAVTEVDLIDYYTTLRQALQECELFAYVFPARTGVDISPEELARVVVSTELTGVKVSIPGVDYVRRLVAALPSDAVVYSGNDGLLPEVLDAGGRGIVSGVMQAGPEPFLAQAAALRSHGDDAVLESRRAVDALVATYGPRLDVTKQRLVAESIFAAGTLRVPHAQTPVAGVQPAAHEPAAVQA